MVNRKFCETDLDFRCDLEMLKQHLEGGRTRAGDDGEGYSNSRTVALGPNG